MLKCNDKEVKKNLETIKLSNAIDRLHFDETFKTNNGI